MHDGGIQHGEKHDEGGAGHVAERPEDSAQPEPRLAGRGAQRGPERARGHAAGLRETAVGSEGDRRNAEEHEVERRRPAKVRVAHDAHVDLGGDGLELAPDDHGGGVVGDGAHEGEQQADGKRRSEQGDNDVQKHPAHGCAEVKRRLHGTSVHTLKDAPDEDDVDGREEERLHEDDAPPAVGAHGEAKKAVGHQAAAAEELDVGEGGHEGGRYHAHRHQGLHHASPPDGPEGEHECHRKGQGTREQARQEADEGAVGEDSRVLRQHVGNRGRRAAWGNRLPYEGAYGPGDEDGAEQHQRGEKNPVNEAATSKAAHAPLASPSSPSWRETTMSQEA